jgi:hypothetical protein
LQKRPNIMYCNCCPFTVPCTQVSFVNFRVSN